MDDAALRTYLHDHLIGANAAIRVLEERADRVAEDWLLGLRDEFLEERAVVEQLVERLGGEAGVMEKAGGRLAELGARVHMEFEGARNERLRDLLELELVRTGIAGKGCLWRSLRELQHDPRVAAVPVEDLHAQAERQAELVEDHRRRAAAALGQSTESD